MLPQRADTENALCLSGLFFNLVIRCCGRELLPWKILLRARSKI